MKQTKKYVFTMREVIESLKEKYPKFKFDDMLWSLKYVNINDKNQTMEVEITEKEIKI